MTKDLLLDEAILDPQSKKDIQASKALLCQRYWFVQRNAQQLVPVKEGQDVSVLVVVETPDEEIERMKNRTSSKRERESGRWV